MSSVTPRLFNQRHKDPKRRPPPDAVYVGRPSKWGNPFALTQEELRPQVIQDYERWLLQQPDLVAAARVELRGRNLVCWCHPKPCHGSILLRVANE